MKKTISLILCLLMLASLMAACGKDKKETAEGGKIDIGSILEIPGGNNQNSKPKDTTPKDTTSQNTQPQTSLPVLDDGKAFTYEDITLTVPKDFQDITQQASFGIYNFVVGNDDYAVCAVRHASGGMAYMAYAKEVAKNTENATQPKDQGSYATFSYEASGYGMDFVYEVGVYPSGDQIWLVQAYCQKNAADTYRDTLLAILASAVIDSSKSSVNTTPDTPAQTIQGKTYTHKNVSMTIPEDFQDLTQQASMGVYSFVVGKVVGNEANLVLASRADGFTAEDYVDQVVPSLNLTRSVQNRAGYVYLQYENSSMGIDYVYDVGLFEDSTGLWVIQISSLKANYSRDEAMLLGIMDSIRVK